MFNWQKVFSNREPLAETPTTVCPTDLTCVIPLAHRTLLRVAGPDTEKFLQGQCTCDMNRLAVADFLLGAHCNHKGRMHSSFTVAKLSADIILLQVHSGVAEHAFTSLKKYIVFSKAELSVANDIGSLYLAGPDAKKILQDAGLATPAPGKFYPSEQTVILHRSPDQFEIWGDENILLPLLNSGAIAMGENYLDLLNIRRGIGEVRAQTIEEFIPQDLNFQLVDGISFGKGCYTGQEIIARMHYKGKVKKHMYRGVTEVEVPPMPATAIVDEAGKSIGKVVFAAWDENRRVEFLALASDDAMDDPTFISEAKISWLPLPYAIPK